MPIDHKRRIIFVHVPKTAGTSIERALGIFGGISNDRMFGLDMQHAQASQIQEQFPAEWQDFFTFSCVRNPLDRIISEHSWRMGQKTNDHSSLDAFVFYYLQDFENVRGSLAVHIMPQASILDRKVDLIGRFESLDTFWEDLQDQTSVTVKLPMHNVSKKKSSVSISCEAAQLICEFYNVDFKAFSYPLPDFSSFPESSVLKEIEVAIETLSSAREALKRFKDAKRWCELALLSKSLRTTFPEKEIGWLHGLEACLELRDFGRGAVLVQQALEKFDSYLMLRMCHSLSRAVGDDALMLEISTRMVAGWPDKEDANIRHMQGLLALGYAADKKHAEIVQVFLARDRTTPQVARVRRQIFRSQNDFERAFLESSWLVEKGDAPAAILLAIDDLSQLGMHEDNWSWVDEILNSDTLPLTVRQRARERCREIARENLANELTLSAPRGTPANDCGPIHMMWMQGEDYAPVSVRICIARWRKLNPDIEVIVHDGCAVQNLLTATLGIDIDDIPPDAASYLFRTAILQREGGTWVDPTLYPTWPLQRIHGWLGAPEFFVMDGLTPEKYASGWFITSQAGEASISALLTAVIKYWSVKRLPLSKSDIWPKHLELSSLTTSQAAMLVDGSDKEMSDKFPSFWWHYLFNSLVGTDQEFQKSYARRLIRPNPLHAHRLKSYLRRTPDPDVETIKGILDEFPFQKLSHKYAGYPGMEKGISYLERL